MDHLYAPWREEYAKSLENSKSGCVFCHILNNPDEDEKNGVLFRGEGFFIVMNKYPYTPGHFMIVPDSHIADLEDLDEKVWADMGVYAKKGVKILKEALGAKGVNIGMNIGKAAGAGIAEHLHLHVLPRWMGDTNFITSIGEVRVYSVDFDRIYEKLKKFF